MRYNVWGMTFILGELKKEQLNFGNRGTAHRIRFCFLSCGQKKFELSDLTNYVSLSLGLSGSGKSTLTHAKHDGKYQLEVLHDDAFYYFVNNGFLNCIRTFLF